MTDDRKQDKPQDPPKQGQTGTEKGRGIDGLDAKGLAQAGGDQYAYLDQTRELHEPLFGLGDGVPSAVLNPAYYPRDAKPEVLHNEREKAGSESPVIDTTVGKDRSRTGEDLEKDYLANRPWLKDSPVPVPAETVSAGSLKG